MTEDPTKFPDATIAMTAIKFVSSRQGRLALVSFPGTLPDDIDTAYAIQVHEIALWPDRIAGWKVGRLSPDLAARHGFDRFIGPIFAESIDSLRTGQPTPFPMIAGGFAAFEAEIVLTLGEDADPARLEWTLEDARTLVSGMNIGIEVAGSSLSTINGLGSIANISGFGNNLGLILGAEIEDWRDRSEESLTCRTTIDGVLAGEGRAAGLPGGIMTGLAYALGQAARLGHPMKAGMLISTGAVTGVHVVTAGQNCVADFGDLGAIECVVTPV